MRLAESNSVLSCSFPRDLPVDDETCGIGNSPADWNAHPYSRLANWSCHHIGKKNPETKADDGEKKGDRRMLQCTEYSIEKEKESDEDIEGSFDSQISSADIDDIRFRRVDEDSHQLIRDEEYDCRDCKSEEKCGEECKDNTFSYSVMP